MALAQPAAEPPHVAPEPGVDDRIRPGDDFDAYANGAWLAATEIPSGRNRWGARDDIDALTQAQMTALMHDAASRPEGSPGRKVADFQAAWLDGAAIVSAGLSPVQPLLDRIAAVHDKAALATLLGSGLRADVDPLNWGVFASTHVFGLSVEPGIHGDGTYHAYLLQGGLALLDRQPYLDSSPSAQALRRRYLDHIGRMLQLAGFDRSAQRALAVLDLEIAIAATHAPEAESANERNADHHWSRADFASKAPGLDWPAFFAAAGLSTVADIVVWQPGAVAGEAALVASQPLETWQDDLRFHAIDRHADVLPRPFAEAIEAMHAAEPPAMTTPAARARRAMEATGNAMPEAVGRLYVELYFPAASKARVQAIASHVMDAFGKRIAAVPWMSPATKAKALVKLKALYFGVGYPETWTDMSGLAIDPHDAFGNAQRVADWNYARAIARLGRPVDRTEWALPAFAVGAASFPLWNGYNFAAALLQAPKFDPAASDATVYGSIGAIFGHEMSHFVDTLGAEYDADGASSHWWLPDDEVALKAASQPLVDQYSAYHPLPGLVIDGRLALVENIADLGGLAAAFDAYRAAQVDRSGDRAAVRQRDRQFFIGFARAWRVKMDDAAVREKAASDHAPERLRIATVRNLDAWYEAFDIRPGDRLYLAPKDRVRIW